ncbi:MAG: hypothetical protein NTY36_13410 [Deltaproteobacteria bacterium]|nr:hypothetical protein [Deltaproteobacteria bacterium]
MPEGYRCPFCPDHVDEDFLVWETLLAEPICDGCTYDIFNALLVIPPVDLLDPEKIPRLEQLTGKPALELSRLVVQEDIALLEDKENLERKIRNSREFPGETREKIEMEWHERLAQMRSLLAELEKLATEKK